MTGTLRCLQKEMATYRHWSVSLWRDPDDVPHCQILSPDKTEWRLISATLCGWRHCFVADQLWFMTHIREEEEEVTAVPSGDRKSTASWKSLPSDCSCQRLNAQWITAVILQLIICANRSNNSVILQSFSMTLPSPMLFSMTGNHLVPCVAESVWSCIPIHAPLCLPDPKCLFYPSGLSLRFSVDHFCLVPVPDMVLGSDVHESGCRWFPGHVLHRAVNNQDVIKTSDGHRNVVVR